jgi:LysR family positive regulator for ilvC
MEQELGHELIVRDRKDLRLTEAGQRFVEFCRQQTEAWQQLREELQEEATAPTGELKIACTVTACHTLLPDLLSRFRARYPGVTLRLFTQDAARSLLQLENSEIDVAVIPTEADVPQNLASVGIAHTDLSFIAPVASPLVEMSKQRTKLDQLPLVAPISGLEQVRLASWLKDHAALPQIVAEVRGNEGIISLVALGAGIALVPRLVLEHSPLRHRVEELPHLTPPPGYQISLCVRKTSLTRRVVALFFDLTRTHRQPAAAHPSNEGSPS